MLASENRASCFSIRFKNLTIHIKKDAIRQKSRKGLI